MLPTHVIRDFELDIAFPSEGEAVEKNSRLSWFASERLVTIAHEVFTRFSEEKQAGLCLDAIEIDLGEIASDHYFPEAEDRFRRLLEEELQARWFQQRGVSKTPGAVDAVSDSADRDLELVFYWLMHGHLPWNARQEDREQLDAMLKRVVAQDGARLLKQLRGANRAGDLARRLAWSTSREVRELLAASFDEPGSGLKENLDGERDWELHFARLLDAASLDADIERATREILLNGDHALLDRWKQLLAREPSIVEQVIRRVGRDLETRSRMAERLPDRILVDITELLEPVESRFVLEVVRRPEIFSAAAERRGESAEQARVSTWQMVLTYLLAERGTRFNRNEFLKSTVRQMAGHYNQHVEEMAGALRTAFQTVELEGQLKQEILAILESIAGDARARNGSEQGGFCRQESDPLQPWAETRGGVEEREVQTESSASLTPNEFLSALGSDPAFLASFSKYCTVSRLRELVEQGLDRPSVAFVRDIADAIRTIRSALPAEFATLDAERLLWEMAVLCCAEGADHFDRAAFIGRLVRGFASKHGLQEQPLLTAIECTLKRAQIAGQSQDEILKTVRQVQQHAAEELLPHLGDRWDCEFERALLSGESAEIARVWEQWRAAGEVDPKKVLCRILLDGSSFSQSMRKIPVRIVRELIAELYPADLSFVDRVIAYQENVGDVVGLASVASLSEAWWQATLLYAVSEKRLSMNRLALVNLLLREFASHCKVSFETVVDQLMEMQKQQNPARQMPEELKAFLSQWQRDGEDQPTRDNARPAEELATVEQLIEGYKLYDNISLLANRGDAAGQELGLLLGRAHTNYPWIWQRVLRESEQIEIDAQDRDAITDERLRYVEGRGWLLLSDELDSVIEPSSGRGRPRRRARLLTSKVSSETHATRETLQLPSLTHAHAETLPMLLELGAGTSLGRSVIAHITDAQLARVLLDWSPKSFARWLTVAEALATAAGVKYRDALWLILFEELDKYERLDDAAFVRRFVGRLAKWTKRDPAELSATIRSSLKTTAMPKHLRSVMLAALDDGIHHSTNDAAPAQGRTSSEKRDSAGRERTADPIFIGNAGQVLVAPFLPRLFGMLGLVEDGKFSDEMAAHRAVRLVQFLVDGREETWEGTLPLNKILCGLEPEQPVNLNIALTSTEVAACEELLGAIIAHWSAIGRTSVQGLRESFLQREGRLTHSSKGWQLLVQERAFDMLLDRLPWSIKVIKLQWMTKALYVEWR